MLSPGAARSQGQRMSSCQPLIRDLSGVQQDWETATCSTFYIEVFPLPRAQGGHHYRTLEVWSRVNFLASELLKAANSIWPWTRLSTSV